MRKSISSLHSRLWEPVEIQPIPQEVYGYVRFLGEAEQPILVLLNFFAEPAEMTVELPEKFSSLLAVGRLYDLLSDEELAIDRTGPLVIPVPGLSARIL